MNSQIRKKNLRPAFLARLIAGMVVVAPAVFAANDYWYPLNAGGTWDTTTANWSLTGNNAGTAAAWVSGSPAIFGTTTDGGADAYPITIGASGLTADSFTFKSSGYQFIASSPQTVTIGSANNYPWTNILGKTVYIGNNVTVLTGVGGGNSARIGVGGASGGTLTIESGGIFQRGGASGTGGLVFNTYPDTSTSESGTVNVSGTVNYPSASGSGQIVIGQLKGAVTMNVQSGGLVQNLGTGGITVGNAGGNGTLNLSSGGQVLVGNTGTSLLVANNASSTGTVNLNGGTITAPKVAYGAGTGIFHFNGGTLKANLASATFLTGLTTVDVKSGGGTIDNGGYAITIGQALTDGSSGNSGDAVTFTNSSATPVTTTLTGVNTYAGATTVGSGTLLVNSPGSLAASSAVTVFTNATLGGNGTINGTVTANAGAILFPGSAANIIGTLTLANSGSTALTLNGNTLVCNLPSSGTTCGLIAVTGTLVVNGTSYVALNATNGTAPAGTYTIMTYAAKTGSGSILFPNGSTTMGNATLSVGSTSVTVTLGTGGLTNVDVWSGGISGVWDGGTLNWNKNGVAIQAYTGGDFVIFDDTGSAAATISSGAAVTPASVVFSNSVNNYKVSAIINGAGTTLSKNNSGSVTLSGANGYTGGTTLNAGTLEADNSAALGSGLLVINGGVLTNNVSATLTNNINLASATTLGIGSGQTLTLGGVITNSGSLTVVGAGTLVLTNANTYSGGTVLNVTASLKNGLGFGTGTVTVNAAGVAYNLSSTSLTFTNAVTLNGGQFHTGGGNSGTKNTWAGLVTLTANSSVASDGGTTGNAFTGGLNMGNGGYTFTVNGNGNNSGSANNFNSVISGGPNATFITASGGQAYLNAANTYSGTNRSNYQLILQNVNAMQNATLDMNAADSGTVTLINNAIIGALTGSRNLNLNVSSISIGNNNSSTTFSGALTNSGSLTKVGTGTLTLSGANTYAGNTTISAGSLALSGSGSLASPTITVASGATFDVSGLTTAFTFSSQTLSNSAPGAVINGTNSTGSGTLSLVYDGVNPAFIITNGGMTISSLTTIKVKNTGATLTPGTYKIIAKATAGNVGLVAGTAPSSVTVVGGPSAGTPSLSIVNGELYLTVGGVSTFGYTGASFTYNGLGQEPAISFSGSTNSKTTNYVGVSVSYGPSVNAPTNAGSYYVSNTVTADANYFGTTNSLAFTISTKSASVTATAQTKNYGAVNPTLTATTAGTVGSDTLSYTLATDATQFSDVGVSNIAVTLGSNPNYSVSATNSTLTITAATTVFTGLSSVTNSYGVTNIVLTGTVSAAGSLYPTNGETVSASINGFPVSGTVTDGTGDFTINYNDPSLATNGVAGSPYVITYNYSGDGNLAAAADSSTSVTITNALLTITANDDSKTYDGNGYTTNNGVSYVGFVNGETNTVLGGTLNYNGTAQGATNAGSYTIIPSGLTSTNYAITYSNGTLTVYQAGTSIAVVSSENPSGYHDSVGFTATLPADATGSVVFSSANGSFSTNSVSSGSASSLSITSLLRGTNVITCAYLGDGNYIGSTNSLNQIVTNHPPVASNITYTRNAAVSTFKVLVSDLLTNASDVDGDSLTLVSVSGSTNGITPMISGGWVLYSNANAVADQFGYTVTDGYGGTNGATVIIAIDSTPLFGQSQVGSVMGGTATLNFAGIPTYSYSVNRSTNLTDWITIWTTNAPAGGAFQFIDTSAPTPSAFYQLQFNP